MVHRDVKPSNLMLNSAGQLKLLDLGLALLHDPAWQSDQLTALGSAMGTADYVAPEQSGDSHNVDIRADIYSLGCTMFKLLTGRAPFPKPKYKTSLQKMMAHRGEPFPDVTAERLDVSRELKAVLDRMVAKDPNQRFATPAQVAAELAPFCQGHDLTKIASIKVATPRTASEISTTTIVAAQTPQPGADHVRPHLDDKTPTRKTVHSAGTNRHIRIALTAAGAAILLGLVVFTLVVVLQKTKTGDAAHQRPNVTTSSAKTEP
jgi:serine/threonine protein kinase